MSSTYHLLCLSHDPAIVITDPGYNRPEAAEAALAAGVEGHTTCDLAIGRYSYPLIELGCPRSADQPDHLRPGTLRCYHGSTKWTDRDWLRLLAAGYQTTDPLVQAAVTQAQALCWPWDRLKHLHTELGFADTTATPCCASTYEAAIATALGGNRTANVIAHTLHTHGYTLTRLTQATDAELLTIPGIGNTSLTTIRTHIPAQQERP